MAAQALRDENDTAFIEALYVVNPSDPDQSQSFFHLHWKFYTCNLIALTSFMAPPEDNTLTTKN
jgi:hypothetical protein